MKLPNHVSGKWVEGSGEGVPLIDPVTGEELARATSDGIDLAAALDYARAKGGPALRALTSDINSQGNLFVRSISRMRGAMTASEN